MVEAGIHPLDVWRYWLGDVAWVQAAYVHRPAEEIIDGADNPYAYASLFGFASGALGTITLSRLRRVYHSDFGHRVLWNEGHLHLEPNELVVYHYDGPYPPTESPAAAQVRQTLATPPANNTTYAISRAFMLAVAERAPELIRSPFGEAMNSLTAVLAANVSDALDGARVYLDELLTSERYAAFRARP
jgi:predicted dehydrogenase